jgi:hypothetical protein
MQKSASPLLRSKKEAPDTADPQQVLTPEEDRSVLASDVVARVPSTRWLKKVEAKMISEAGQSRCQCCSQRSSQSTANAPANAPANVAGNAANHAANATKIQENTAPNPRRNAGAHPPPLQANRVEGSQHHRIRDEVEIARRANYDREHGVPDALDANNPIQVIDLRIMHDQELLRRA